MPYLKDDDSFGCDSCPSNDKDLQSIEKRLAALEDKIGQILNIAMSQGYLLPNAFSTKRI